MKNPTFGRSGNVQRYVPDPRPHVGEKAGVISFNINCL